jgi:hypothetical protein
MMKTFLYVQFVVGTLDRMGIIVIFVHIVEKIPTIVIVKMTMKKTKNKPSMGLFLFYRSGGRPILFGRTPE